MRRLALVSLAVLVPAMPTASAAPGRDLPVPAPEHRAPTIPSTLPAAPAFEPPAPNADGTHTVRELRVAGTGLLDHDIAVAGVVTYVPDCVTAVRKPGESVASARARIDADPTLCERPKFFIGDSARDSPDRSLWIVDVPRPYNKLELQMIAKADRTAPDRCEPHERDPAKRVCPPYRVGDRVIVVGRFALASQHKENNSDGLIVYHAMKNLTARWVSPGGITIPPGEATPATPLPSPPPVLAPAAASPVAPDLAAASRRELARGNVALGNKQLADAQKAFRAATATWPANHLAWYGLGGALAEAGDWHGAVDAFRHAAALYPAQAMYQMWLGVALYEDALARARADQAKRLGESPDRVVAEPRGPAFVEAWQHLQLALAAEPHLWRAQYFAAKIAIANGEPKLGADALLQAIADDPRQQAPYVALENLDLKWDAVDHAIAVGTQGVQLVPSTPEVGAIWFDLGRAYDAKHDRAHAIDAYGHAVDVEPADRRALLQRGLDYAALRDARHARADLEAFIAGAADNAYELTVAHLALARLRR